MRQTFTTGATVADELFFSALPQEIRELAIRVLVEEVDEDEIRREGYNEGESDGYAEAQREAREKIADLEDEVQERDEEIETLNDTVTELKARIDNMIARCAKCEYNMEGKLFPCPAHV